MITSELRSPVAIDWSSAIWSGIIAGAVFMMLEMVMVAMAIHFTLSIVLAVILALVVKGLGLGMAGMVGAIFGLVIYLINFYGLTAFFPWFEMARNWISIFAHVMFGAVAALSYKWLQKPNGQAART